MLLCARLFRRAKVCGDLGGQLLDLATAVANSCREAGWVCISSPVRAARSKLIACSSWRIVTFVRAVVSGDIALRYAFHFHADLVHLPQPDAADTE